MKSLLQRLTEKYTADPITKCWVWTAKWQSSGGYGWLARGGRKDGRIAAHRASYELHVGPIPEGLDLDHLCRNRLCVNPAHLEPVTRSENVKRGLMPAINRARAAAQTHCVNGHEFTAENTSVSNVRGRTTRRCRECRLRAQRAAYHAARCA